MLKIGLITFHRAINYGAVLQSYALQKVFDDFGSDCTIIDFRCHELEHFYKPFLVYKGSLKYMIKQGIKMALVYHDRKKKKAKFESFVQKYLRTSESITNKAELDDADFDIFVTGSDQVFNPTITGADAEVYYLSFTEKKKYSYAASFGKDIITDIVGSLIKSNLNDYERISVREESGAQIIKQIIGRDASVNIDPTLLIDGTEWREIEEKPKEINKPYILAYNMLTSKFIFEAAEALSKQTGIDVVFVNHKNDKTRFQYHSFRYYESFSPQEFLWLIDHAEYVLTSSFHGTVFSVLFKKQFLTVLSSTESRNVRLFSLLHMVGLMNRVVVDNCSISNITEKINWDLIQNRIVDCRSDATSYIKQIIEENSELI